MNKFLGLIAGALLACMPVAAQTQQPIRINCGGGAYTDTNGQVWQADSGYNTGIGTTNKSIVAGTSDPALYQSNRYNQSTAPMVYSFPVANAAIVEGFNTVVTNGAMAIEFDKLVQNPKINAIEILPIAAAPSLMLKFSYPDGTPVIGALHYAISTSLLTLGGSIPLVNGQATCLLVASPQLLGLIGQTQVFLNLTDGSGTMVWQVSMGLNPANADLSSMQNSTLNVILSKP